MAVSVFKMHHNGLLKICDQSIDFVNDTIYAILVDNAHTPAVATEDFVDDIVANECSDGDYSRLNLTSQAITLTGGKIRFDAAQMDFGSAVTISARYLYIAKNAGGADSANAIIGHFDLNDGGSTNVSSTSSDFKVDFHANGMYEITP